MIEAETGRQTVFDTLRRTAARHPGKPAVRQGSRGWNYAGFRDLSLRIAGGLVNQGIRPGDRVAILSRNSAAFAATRYGIAAMGAILVKGYYGASIMPVEIMKRIQQRLPQIRLWNLYGQTEIAPTATILKPEDQLRKPGSAGKPVLHVETRIVDDQGNDVTIGEVGEIVHRSPQLLSGYYNDPERTAAAFEGGWFHSGDLATMDEDGYITVVDRKRDMIKSGGENVSGRDVEEAIYSLPGIAEVAVIGIPHPKWIEAVVAVVVLKEGADVSGNDIIDHCAAKLAAFKVPKRILFTAQLPRNPSGKILKRDLREAFRAVFSDVAARM